MPVSIAPVDATATYKPLEIPEKDPIRRKYGIVDFTSAAYAPHELQPDPATGEAVWAYQVTPHDNWDYDAISAAGIERVRGSRATRPA